MRTPRRLNQTEQIFNYRMLAAHSPFFSLAFNCGGTVFALVIVLRYDASNTSLAVRKTSSKLHIKAADLSKKQNFLCPKVDVLEFNLLSEFLRRQNAKCA